MGYINIFASSKAHVAVKNEQLVLTNDQKQMDYPLTDISSVMLENRETTISTYALSELAAHNILVFICDQAHLPNGVLLPFNSYYQALTQYHWQIAMPKPLQKQLWQSIIKNKIANQNQVLNLCGGHDELKPLIGAVLSDDATNVEAKASLLYFKALFGPQFIRRDDNVLNACLNYGYAIIRGFVARSITAHGLLPFLGIHHANQLNNFNLADDLMEVFRPVVDLLVKQELGNVTELTTTVKAQLYNLMNVEVGVERGKYALDYAIELLVQNFIKSAKEKSNCLSSITIFGLGTHRYE